MITLPQEAMIMVGKPHQKIIQELQRALTLNQTKPLSGGNGVVHALLENNDIPPFTLPLKLRDVRGETKIVVDLRRSKREYRLDPMGQTFSPLPLTDAKFLTDLALLILAWSNNPNQFSAIYNQSCRIYASWIGFEISKRLTLSVQDQSKLIMYFAYFWLTRSMPGKTLHQNDFVFIVITISRLFGFKSDEVNMTLQGFQLEIPANLDELCKKIESLEENPKLRNFNALLVMTMLFGGWMSSINPRELIGVAVEYPPLFIMMVYRGLSERGFKKARIADLSLRLFDNREQQSFSLTVAQLLKTTSNGADYIS